MKVGDIISVTELYANHGPIYFNRLDEKYLSKDGHEFTPMQSADAVQCTKSPEGTPLPLTAPRGMFNPDMSNDFDTHIGQLTEEVFNWAEEAFPNRTDPSMFLKMYSEIGEMIDSDGDRLEVADVFILMLDYAKRKKVDITAAVRAKLEINRARDWAVDNNGVMSHVKD
jgi:hypothetical protein